MSIGPVPGLTTTWLPVLMNEPDGVSTRLLVLNVTWSAVPLPVGADRADHEHSSDEDCGREHRDQPWLCEHRGAPCSSGLHPALWRRTTQTGRGLRSGEALLSGRSETHRPALACGIRPRRPGRVRRRQRPDTGADAHSCAGPADVQAGDRAAARACGGQRSRLGPARLRARHAAVARRPLRDLQRLRRQAGQERLARLLLQGQGHGQAARPERRRHLLGARLAEQDLGRLQALRRERRPRLVQRLEEAADERFDRLDSILAGLPAKAGLRPRSHCALPRPRSPR